MIYNLYYDNIKREEKTTNLHGYCKTGRSHHNWGVGVGVVGQGETLWHLLSDYFSIKELTTV